MKLVRLICSFKTVSGLEKNFLASSAFSCVSDRHSHSRDLFPLRVVMILVVCSCRLFTNMECCARGRARARIIFSAFIDDSDDDDDDGSVCEPRFRRR